MAARSGTLGDQADSPAEQVRTTLFRVLAVLRVVVLLYALTLNLGRFDEFARPWVAGAGLAFMVVWSAFVTWAYDAPRRRRLPLYVADLAVAVGLLLLTPVAESEAMLDRHASTLPSFWVMASVLAWAVGRGWPEAVGAAAVVSLADVSTRSEVTGTTWGNIFLLVLAAGIVGFASDALAGAAEATAAAERAQAAYAERVRLSRAVHDGVLQVLSLVQRRGAEAGDDWVDLARLAGEQEVALRNLVQLQARPLVDQGELQRDLVAALDGLATLTVSVAGPGHDVLLPALTVEELAAVVRACLDNVTRHVGVAARVWILVEDLGASVLVSVRDEGPGIPEGRLAAAEAEGRLGVSGSIRGRMHDLGGRADLVSGPSGTEWELTVMRDNLQP